MRENILIHIYGRKISLKRGSQKNTPKYTVETLPSKTYYSLYLHQ